MYPKIFKPVKIAEIIKLCYKLNKLLLSNYKMLTKWNFTEEVFQILQKRNTIENVDKVWTQNQ
jgi:hypothetical protein